MTTQLQQPEATEPWEAWVRGQYRHPGGTWVTQKVLYELEGKAWRTGIEADKKKRGSSINLEVTAEGVWQGQALAIVQVRQCTFNPRWDYKKIRKDYYLVGRNENTQAFAHPIAATSRTTVRKALAKVWRCDERDLDDIERNGDVAFVPIRKLPADLEPVLEPVRLAESHELTGNVFRSPKGNLYIRKAARIRHLKGQHPTAKVKEGWWRVQVAIRAAGWGFSQPTAD